MKLSKRKFFLFLFIMGPGIIVATADNDAGGIATYSVAGAEYGLKLLWLLFLITFTLAIVQEMCARMGVVTGKGLSDLIREQFGVKLTFFTMTALLIANITTTIAEFAGVAASLEIFKITKFISVPLIAIIIWTLIVKGSFRYVERILLGFCLIFFTYVISGILVNPPWNEVIRSTLIPHISFDKRYLWMSIAVVGTTITPWMQFFLQSLVVDKGIRIDKYKYEKLDVFLGAFWTDFIAFFIIVCAAVTLYKNGIVIKNASDAALALSPFAGGYCKALFATGLFGASVLAACVLPLCTSYAICEAFGWESGINKTFNEAPVFFGLYTILILIGAGIVLIPKIPLIPLMLFAQSVNGILLPAILIPMLFLINDKRIMGKYVNSPVYNIVVWTTAITIMTMTLFLLVSYITGFNF